MRVYLVFFLVLIFSVGCEKKAIGNNVNKKEEHLAKIDENIANENEMLQEIEDPLNEKNIDENSIESINKDMANSKEAGENYATKANLWRSYRAAKEAVKKAKIKKDFRNQVKYLLEAAKFASELERFDIEAWQYNNAGYVLIEEFKCSTNYYSEMNKLNNLIYKNEIKIVRKEIRSNMLYDNKLLIEAEGYLLKAKKIDSKLAESSRTITIASNINFIEDVRNFLENDL